MPLPRRKSCFGCIKAKRRCDLGQPVCQRCSDKGLTCDYGDLPHSNGNHRPSGPSQDTDIQAGSGSSGTSSGQYSTPADALFIDDSHMELSFSTGPQDNIDWTLVNDVDQWLPPHTSDYMVSGQMYEQRTRFDGKQFKSWPILFSKTGRSPFIHRAMYEENTPTAIQEALSACALYSTKNDENETFVFRDISRKVRNLINSTNILSPPSDLLASSQALLLYQMIRLFDGDIRQRGDAEADEAILMTWITQLETRRQPATSSTLLLDDSAHASLALSSSTAWQSWMYQESLRRTVLTGFMLQGVYEFLKKGWDTVSGCMHKLDFTAQARLWNAPSEFHWRNTWQEERHLVVRVHDWDAAIFDVTPEDLDELGVLMMATHKGMEILTEWLGQSNLAKYGLEWGSADTKD